MHTIHEYAGFIRRRWRFILSGTMLAAAISGVVSFALPDVYTAWITIDGGTLAARRRVDIDVFRGTFNGGAYRESITDFPPGSITKAWMEFDPPHITIRVDATDGSSAAAGSTRVAQYTIAELSKLPVFTSEDALRLRASVADTAAVQASLDRLDQWSGRAITDAESKLGRLIAERSRILDEMWAAGASDATAPGQRRSRVDRLAASINAVDRLIDEIKDLENGAVRLKAFQDKEFSQVAIPALRSALDALPQSVEQFVETVDRVERLTVETTPLHTLKFIPMRIIVPPQAPSTSRWPNRPLNVLIAALFGVVGSSFAALVLERKE